MFIAVQFTIGKYWKQPKCPSVNEWMKELWNIYMMEYYTAERKKELLPFMTWMELETIMLSEISQEVKDKYCCDLTYNRNVMNKANKCTK